MKSIVFIIIHLIFITLSYSQETCLIDGQYFTSSSKPLCTYQIPSDTTEHLITNTYFSLTKDSLYYADVLKHQGICTSLLIIKSSIKDLKNDVGFKIDEILLNEKTKAKGFVLTVYTSIGHNVFNIYQASARFGSTAVNGNILNIMCENRESAEILMDTIDKMVKAK